ncbi:hypothetical protein [Paraburkholderia sp. Cpub6]|nr:hypothetical protein [Paraburkholderia sp. Cpub6]MBB5461592.1 FMN phosphatase YigB (HAD superfamily) [Paraburkholderia sp. Cpub6]
MAATDTLFIDDSQASVDGALAAGFQGFRFVDAASLSIELARRGVL